MKQGRWTFLLESDYHQEAKRICPHRPIFSIEPKGDVSRTLIFIHGFGGSSTGTWRAYPALLREHIEFRNCRFVFYDYESRTMSLDLLEQELRAFVDKFAAEHDISAQAPLTLVGHSVGGLLVRLVIMNAHELGLKWLSSTNFILLAPAQAGTDIERLVLESAGPWVLKLVAGGVRFKWIILKDIREDSRRVLALDAFLKTEPSPLVRPMALLVPPSDPVVRQLLLDGDPPFTVVPDSTHSTITRTVGAGCKKAPVVLKEFGA